MVSINQMVSIKPIRTILIDEITPEQRKLIVSVYTTDKTSFQMLLNATWRRVKCAHRNCIDLKMKFNLH